MDKIKSLESTISQIERNFGKGSVMRLGEREVIDIDAISSGSLSSDVALEQVGYQKEESSKYMDQKVLENNTCAPRYC